MSRVKGRGICEIGVQMGGVLGACIGKQCKPQLVMIGVPCRGQVRFYRKKTSDVTRGRMLVERRMEMH